MFMSEPGGMANPETRRAREAMMATAPHYAGVAAYRDELIARRHATWKPDQFPVVVPHFDPADAGTEARALVVLESPGPMTYTERHGERKGSGFISVDNDDLTAKNTWVARRDAGLTEAVTIQWNIVPWMLDEGVIAPNAAEVAQGALELRRLISVLPKLEVIVACGIPAQKALTTFIEPAYGDDYTYIRTWHPSQRGLAPKGRREALTKAFERAARRVGA